MGAASVSLEQVLAARDARARRQAAALTRFDKPLVSTTVVMPGPMKDGALPRRVLTEALQSLDALFIRRGWRVVARQVLWQQTGPEALHVVDADAGLVKSAAIELEDRHALGRLWDLDVIEQGPRVLSRKALGFPARRCLVCERPAFECARSRRHALQDLMNAIQAASDAHDRIETARRVGEYAGQALLVELMLTPKPGLVDRRNCGAHRDMDLETFLASARAVSPWFPRFVEIGRAGAHVAARDFLELVRPAGLACEEAMLRATRGVNTHKGAIFSLGLLCAAAGRLLATSAELDRERLCAEVAAICAGLVDRELNGIHAARTAGERIFRRYGFTGARGEAASGYATVRTVALPVFERLRRDGVAEDVALLQALLHLLAVNDDTNLVSRGGLDGLGYVRAYAGDLLEEGGALGPDGVRKMAVFDDRLIARRLSPGGSADLLGVTWFLAQLPVEGMGAR